MPDNGPEQTPLTVAEKALLLEVSKKYRSNSLDSPLQENPMQDYYEQVVAKIHSDEDTQINFGLNNSGRYIKEKFRLLETKDGSLDISYKPAEGILTVVYKTPVNPSTDNHITERTVIVLKKDGSCEITKTSDGQQIKTHTLNPTDKMSDDSKIMAEEVEKILKQYLDLHKTPFYMSA